MHAIVPHEFEVIIFSELINIPIPWKKEEAMEDNKKRVNIKFIQSSNHITFPATGAWGGVNPNGEIICHFFIEHQAYPSQLTVEIDESFMKHNEKYEEKEKTNYVRQIQATAVLRPDIAKAIGEWLISHSSSVTKK